LKLLAVSPSGELSGAERVLLRLLDGARASGWAVTCASPPGPLVEALTSSNVRHVELPHLKLDPGPRRRSVPRLAGRQVPAARTLRRLSPDADVIVANGLLVLPALRLAHPRAPVAWLVHDVIHRRSWKAVLEVGKAGVDTAIAVSEAVAAPLRAAGLAVVVIRAGTPWPVPAMPGPPTGPPIIGCAGLLTPWKGQDVLLEAVASLPGTDARVELAGSFFAGDEDYVSALRERAQRPDLRGRVRILGRVDDTLARMRTWTVAVSSSVAPEAGPLVALEAMSVGLPLVGTDLGGTPEILGDAGLLVRPADSAALGVALERLLSDEGLWWRCHEAGPIQVAAGLVLSEQMAAMLTTLAGLGRRARPAVPTRP
jgi:glycosyltransferase involved in cell wall biosynthesis